MFIEKISTPRINKKGEPSKQNSVIFRYECDTCGVIYEKRPGSASRSTSGLTFCNRKCRGMSIRVGNEAYLLTKKKMLEIHGVENLMQLKETREKIKKTLLERYGVENPSHSEEFKEKRKRTHLERYGHEETFQSPEILAKREVTWMKKYGQRDPRNQPHLQQIAKEKSQETMTQSPQKWSSKIENSFAETLSSEYGEVIRQKWVNRWPIDYYIPSVDTYVQLDGVYWHGLDKPIEEIRESKRPRDIGRVQKWEQDRKQEAWFAAHSLRLVRVTDIEVKDGTALSKIRDISGLLDSDSLVT